MVQMIDDAPLFRGRGQDLVGKCGSADPAGWSALTLAHSRFDFSDACLAVNREIPLSTGRICRIERALRRYIEDHYVVFFPEDTQGGPPTAQEVSDLLQVTYREARRLAREIYRDDECFSITMNGRRTGTWPSVVHAQIYLFKNREEKIRCYDRVTSDLRRALDEGSSQARDK